MSGSASISLEQAILGHTLGFAQMAFPSSVFVALCSASMPPSETVRGIEAFGGGYTRMRATFALIDTPANIAANTTSIEWPVATASWGTLGFFELWDALSGGNRLYWGPFSPPDPVTVAAGDVVRFSAGTLGVQASSGSGGTTSIGAYLPLAGGSMGGPLLLSHDPATYLEAATKQYVDTHSGSGGGPGFLPLSGGTMLGSLTLAGNATAALQAVPLRQVSTAATGAINVKDYGATGDGGHNDAPAFQAALAAVAAGGKVVVPAGYYNIGAPLSQTLTSTVAFEGAGSGLAILSFSGVGDGLTFSLPSNGNVHIKGFTFIRAFAGATFANSGLVVATPGSGTSLHYGQTSFEDLVFIGGGGGTFWQNQIVMSNCQNTTFEHIYGVLPNADGTGAGATGILISGQSGSSYLTEARFNDVGFAGGHVGLQINTWVQGVYVENCAFGGNDYSIRWTGVSGNADLWLGISNCHFNSGTRGVLAYQAEGTQISNTYNLHFNIPSNDGIYAAFELYNIDGGLITNNNIYLGGSASTSTTEYGIRVMGGNHSIIHGNRIANAKTACILLDSAAQNVIVSSNIGDSLVGGASLIVDTTGNASNQKYGNQFNNVPDITVDTANNLHTPGLVVGNDITTASTNAAINGSATQNRTVSYNTNGLARWYMGASGGTEPGGNVGSDFGIISVNDAGSALIEQMFTIKRSTGVVTLTHPITFNGPFINATNDAGAASGGVQVGGMYRNGSVLMVRTV